VQAKPSTTEVSASNQVNKKLSQASRCHVQCCVTWVVP